MTLQSIYEQDKERLVSVWSGAEKAAIIKTVESEYDRLLYAFNDQEDDPRVREAASAMIRTAKTSAGLIDTAGVTRIYGHRDYIGGEKGTERGAGKILRRFWVLLVLGLLCAVPYVYITYHLLSQVSSEWRWYLLISTPVAAMILLFVAGICLRREVLPDGEQMRAEVLTDPMKVYHQVLAVVLMIDKVLEEIRSAGRAEEKQQLREAAGNVDTEELELLSMLLEDAYARRESDEQAAEMISQIRFYLHRRHIDVVDWNGNDSTGARRNWFDMIPAYNAGTIRPAFAAEEKLLKKGLASSGSMQ